MHIWTYDPDYCAWLRARHLSPADMMTRDRGKQELFRKGYERERIKSALRPLCEDCGIDFAKPGHAFCQPCIDRADMEAYDAAWTRIQAREGDYCRECGTPIPYGMTYCDDHDAAAQRLLRDVLAVHALYGWHTWVRAALWCFVAGFGAAMVYGVLIRMGVMP